MTPEEAHKDALKDFSEEERFLVRKALSRLSAHDDTPAHLTERLSQYTYRDRKVSPESAARAVDFLVGAGLLNEEAYAKNLVRALLSRGYGKRRIGGELYRRRFSAFVTEEVLSGLSEEEAEEEEAGRAFAMLSRRAASRHSDPDDRAEMGRLYGYLARLGYSSEVASAAIRRFQNGEEKTDG